MRAGVSGSCLSCVWGDEGSERGIVTNEGSPIHVRARVRLELASGSAMVGCDADVDENEAGLAQERGHDVAGQRRIDH